MIAIKHDFQAITHVHIRLADARKEVDRRASLAIDAAEQAWSNQRDPNFTQANGRPRLSVNASAIVQPRQSAADFEAQRQWVLAAAFRESVEALWALLDSCWCSLCIADLLAASSKVEVPADYSPAWSDIDLAKEVLGSDWKGFDSSFSHKLDRLESSFGVKSALREQVISMNLTRGVLTHNKGEIRKRDLNNVTVKGCQEGLRLDMIGLRLQGEAENDDGFSDFSMGAMTVEETRLRLDLRRPVTKIFGAGQAIAFEIQDIHDAWYTVQLCAVDLLRCIDERSRSGAMGAPSSTSSRPKCSLEPKAPPSAPHPESHPD